MGASSDHRYALTDASLARPWLTRVWFARLFPLRPRWLAANVATLLSTGRLLAVLLGLLVVDGHGDRRHDGDRGELRGRTLAYQQRLAPSVGVDQRPTPTRAVKQT